MTTGKVAVSATIGSNITEDVSNHRIFAHLATDKDIFRVTSSFAI